MFRHHGLHPEDEEDEHEELVRHSDDNEPLSALAFKMTDPYVGKLAFSVFILERWNQVHVLNLQRENVSV